MLNDELITALLKIADDAGQAILAVYDEPVELTVKADESPLTQADRASHQLIEQRLQALTPQWPVVSEESDDSLKAQRTRFSVYWLVDPLDGTKEFIKRNGEFTVNIALIVDTSGSMKYGLNGDESPSKGQDRMTLTINALTLLAEQLAKHDGVINVTLISFASSASTLTRVRCTT